MSEPAAISNLPGAVRCGTHPEREGVGVCVRCRRVLCVECSTRLDGRNYCIACLRAVAPAAEVVEPAARAPWLGATLFALAFLVAAAMFGALGFLLALWRQAYGGGVTGG